MTGQERLAAILNFLEVADQLKVVYRAAYLVDHTRHESDAEHTWHMALFALLLAREIDVDLDVGHVLELVLVHDLVEIYAGDSWIHDVEDRKLAMHREEEAANRLFSQLPSDTGTWLHLLWREFELGTTQEALFARAMDRLQGFSQNLFAKGRVWRERGVTEEMTRSVNQEAMGMHHEIARVYEMLYERALREGYLH